MTLSRPDMCKHCHHARMRQGGLPCEQVIVFRSHRSSTAVMTSSTSAETGRLAQVGTAECPHKCAQTHASRSVPLKSRAVKGLLVCVLLSRHVNVDSGSTSSQLRNVIWPCFTTRHHLTSENGPSVSHSFMLLFTIGFDSSGSA